MPETQLSEDLAAYYQAQERLKQKETECEILNDKLLAEEEKTESFKKTMADITHDKV